MPQQRIKLRPDTIAALRRYNLKTVGREIDDSPEVTDPEVIERLIELSFPGEDIDDTILRLLPHSTN
jgi:hypothetical protein